MPWPRGIGLALVEGRAFSQAFFREVGAGLGRRMVVFVAWQGDRPVASAICYQDEATLYGRHWGTDIRIPGLHFELCYYSGIEYAIARGLKRFEPGAQGEHKLGRGFEPQSTWPAFWIADPRMAQAVTRFLKGRMRPWWITRRRWPATCLSGGRVDKPLSDTA